MNEHIDMVAGYEENYTPPDYTQYKNILKETALKLKPLFEELEGPINGTVSVVITSEMVVIRTVQAVFHHDKPLKDMEGKDYTIIHRYHKKEEDDQPE